MNFFKGENSKDSFKTERVLSKQPGLSVLFKINKDNKNL